MPVNSLHADYARTFKKWERCRDVAAGQDSVHAGGHKYLPQLKAQNPDDYNSMVTRTPFYNATWRTIAGLVGMIFRKKPKVDLPEVLRPMLDDIDMAGLSFNALLKKVVEQALEVGRIAVLVDYPQVAEGLTKADGERLNLRPTMVTYDTFAVINWRMESVDNKLVLTMLVLREDHWVQDDEFTGHTEEQFRVLDLTVPSKASGVDTTTGAKYRQRVFRVKQGAAVGIVDGQPAKPLAIQYEQIGPDIFPKMKNKPLAYIPAIVLGTDEVSTDVDDPPLIDLVDMNLSHYRTAADLEHGCHFTALPTLVLTGWKKDNPSDKIYLGSETALVTSNDKAKASFAEFTGAGLESLEKNLDRKEKQMAVLGARMLEPQQKQVEANDTVNTRRKGEESMLASVAISISVGMTRALKWFVEWADGDPTNVLVKLNHNFYTSMLTPQMLTGLISAWQQGAPGFSDQSFFDQIQAADMVDEELTLEDEQTRIADRQAEMLAQQQSLFPDRALDGQGNPLPPTPPPKPGAKPGAK